jgi:hypothetical protein
LLSQQTLEPTIAFFPKLVEQTLLISPLLSGSLLDYLSHAILFRVLSETTIKLTIDIFRSIVTYYSLENFPVFVKSLENSMAYQQKQNIDYLLDILTSEDNIFDSNSPDFTTFNNLFTPSFSNSIKSS